MIEELMRQMSRDLNIFRYEDERLIEYSQRLIYSGLASWVRSLLCGNSISDLTGNVDEKFPDILYVQSNLTKVAEAFLKSFDIDDTWIEEENGRSKASLLAGEVIQKMIYLDEIAEINHRLLAPVPVRNYSYKGWTHCYGNDSFDRKCMTLGLSQWVNKEIEGAEEKKRIICIKGKDYIDYIITRFEWNNAHLQGEYELFKVGSNYRYSKSWIPFNNQKLHDGLYLLRDAHNFEPGYTLLRKDGNIFSTSFLNPWYVESREIYRIMYALNLYNGTPTKFRIKDKGDYFVLFYPSRLPEEENKMLFSLSWPYSSYQGKFARIFPKQVMGFVIEEIENIGAYISK
nr:hypothetical protein [uncultured Acetatifactor sp.]